MVKNGSTLMLSYGSTYEIEDGDVLQIDSSASLYVMIGSTLRIKGTGRLEVKKGGFICVQYNNEHEKAILDLQDTLSSICLRNGYICCSSNFDRCKIGNGDFRYYTDTLFIQDTTFNKSTYISGKKITSGYNITNSKPFGNVIIPEGIHVIFDAEKETNVKFGTKIKQNGVLEIR